MQRILPTCSSFTPSAQVVSGMGVLKMYAWERPFRALVNTIRSKVCCLALSRVCRPHPSLLQEMKGIRTINVIRGGNGVCRTRLCV